MSSAGMSKITGRPAGHRLVAWVVLGTLACSTDVGPEPAATVFEATLMARVMVPEPTRSTEIVLTEEDTACIIYSYDEQIHCTTTDGGGFTLGRAGDGPGEFRGLVTLLRGGGGSITAIDRSGLRTLSPSGEVLSAVVLPGFLFGTDRMLGQSLSGTRVTPWAVWLEEIDTRTGEVLWERDFPVDAPGECAEHPLLTEGTLSVSAHVPTNGYLTPWNSVLFICRANLALWEHRDAEEFEVLDPVSHEDEYPNAQDVADYEATMRAVPGASDFAREAREYANTPKHWWMGGQTPVFDQARDWAWIGANRDRESFSYVDIFAGERFEYVGAMRVEGRMVGFDLLGSTLVVLVELPLSDVAIDWYDISGLVPESH